MVGHALSRRCTAATSSGVHLRGPGPHGLGRLAVGMTPTCAQPSTASELHLEPDRHARLVGEQRRHLRQRVAGDHAASRRHRRAWPRRAAMSVRYCIPSQPIRSTAAVGAAARRGDGRRPQPADPEDPPPGGDERALVVEGGAGVEDGHAGHGRRRRRARRSGPRCGARPGSPPTPGPRTPTASDETPGLGAQAAGGRLGKQPGEVPGECGARPPGSRDHRSGRCTRGPSGPSAVSISPA